MAQELLFKLEIDGGKSVQTLNQLKEELKRLKSEFSQAKFGTPEFQQLGSTIKKVEQEAKNLTNSFKDQNKLIPGSVGAIKNEIKELTIALDNAVPGSKEFDLILKQIGKNKGELKEIKENIRGLDDGLDNQIKQFAALGQGIAGAFGIASSASALFGEENEDLNKTLLKVQASMNLLQSIEAVAGSKDAANIIRRILLFGNYKKSVDSTTKSINDNSKSLDENSESLDKNTGEVNQNKTAIEGSNTASKSAVISFKALKLALASIGIGLLITAISELIANWDKVKKSIESIFPVFSTLGNFINETKQNFVGAFYAIKESIIPVASLIGTSLITPFKILIDSMKAVGGILADPFNIDNLKTGVKNLGNVFVDAKDNVVNGLNEVNNAFNKGNDYGKNLEKDRQALEAKKELIQEEIKALEQSVQFLKSGSIERLKVEQDIINKKISITEKGTEDYTKLLVDQFNKGEEIKDFNLQVAKTNAEKREKEFADEEARIKEKYALQNQTVEVEKNIQINEVKTNNPAPEQQQGNNDNIAIIEQQAEIQITKNNLAELEERKANREKHKQDITAIIEEIKLAEQQLIDQTRTLNQNLDEISFNQDTENTKKFVDEQTAIIKKGQLDQLKELQNKNLSAEQLLQEQERIEKETSDKLTNLTRERFKQDIQSRQDANLSANNLIVQQTDFEISEEQRKLNEKARLQAEVDAKKKAEEDAKRQEEDAQRQMAFDALNTLIEIQYNLETTALNNKLSKEKASIDKQVKDGIITKEAGEKKKADIDAKFEKDKRKLERDTAIKKKVSSVAEIAINTAIAISRSYVDAGPIAGNAFAVLMGLMGALQIASVLSQPLPPLAKGGIIPALKTGGKIPSSDKQPIIDVGGKTIDDVLALDENNTPVARVNKGEAIISANSVKMPGVLPILSYINEMGGGAKLPGFALGGIPIPGSSTSVVNNTTNNQFSNEELIAELRAIKEEVSKPSRSYVVESDITSSQSNVKRIEERASF